jgi:hypothetical protein
LILEALRKLEREKQSPDAGLVVVGHTPWTGGSPGGSRPALVALAVVLVASGIGFGVWLGRTPAPVPTASTALSVAPPAQPLESAATTATPPSVVGATVESPVPGPQIAMPPQADSTRPGTPPRAAPGTSMTRVEPSSAGGGQSVPSTTLPVGALPPVTGDDRTPARTAPARTPAAPIVDAEREVDQEPPAAAHASRGELRLQAISQRDGHPIAVINERLVREGESFDGVLVVRIGKAEVEVEVGGRRRTLIF